MPKANLLRAELSDKQLVAASSLLAVTMSDGSLYDGRFNLTGDITIASLIGVDTDNSEAMACWYGVSLEEYLAGQEWARENLAALRREAGLDPDTGLPVEPTNGVEPQPADAPAAPAPRRNGHKASMVAHRVRR